MKLLGSIARDLKENTNQSNDYNCCVLIKYLFISFKCKLAVTAYLLVIIVPAP